MVSDALIGRMAIERWIFAFCNFQLRACKKLLPPQQPPAPSPDVLIASRASFYSAVTCTKRLPIGVGERWSVEGVTSCLCQKGHLSAKSAKGHFTCRTRTREKEMFSLNFILVRPHTRSRTARGNIENSQADAWGN
jgi:hypothetical protein